MRYINSDGSLREVQRDQRARNRKRIWPRCQELDRSELLTDGPIPLLKRWTDPVVDVKETENMTESQKLLQDVETFCQELRGHEELCYLEHRFNDQIIPL